MLFVVIIIIKYVRQTSYSVCLCRGQSPRPKITKSS